MKYFLIFLTVIGLSLSAREILEDPTFKKKDKYWRLTAFEEYKNVEPKYKRKTVEFDISHTSEASYISYITEADTKDDRIYKIEFKFKGDGQGEIFIKHMAYPNFFKRKRYIEGSPLANLGLHQKFTPSSEWQIATCYVKSKVNKESNYMKSLLYWMGSYQGKFTLGEISVTEAKDKQDLTLGDHGLIEVRKEK
jgi:hypothetical protein